MITTAARRLLWVFSLVASLLAASQPVTAQPVPPDDAKPAAKTDDAVIREQTIYIPYTKLRETFEKEGRGVFLPYEKFQELWNAARGREAAPPVVKPPTGELISEIESRQIDINQSLAAHQGRDPKIDITLMGENKNLRRWAVEILELMQPAFEMLDHIHNTSRYQNELKKMLEIVKDQAVSTSARILNEMRDKKECFFAFAMRKSLEHHAALSQLSLTAEQTQQFQAWTQQSLAKQHELEISDTQNIDAFLRNYFQQM